jgi:cholesterol oxidase
VTGQPEHFDAVIVGSGFGGAVTAARLAEAGWRVCVLERGKAYPPNSFPRSPLDMKHNFWDPAEGRHGMFDLWEFDGIDAVCASGLGGGSLIYANVLLRKDEHWFVNEDLAHGGYENWAVTREDLDPHYDEVERRIGIQEYPLGRSPYDQTPKVLAYRQAAENLGLDWSLVPLAVTFAGPGTAPVPGEPIAERPNLHGRSRLTCRLCGECDVGCNSGSKNTLDFTYLSDAWRAGAELRTRCEVRTFKPLDGGGYRVDYRIHSPQAEGTPTDTSALELHTVTCSHLVLSAGTMGTNWLLWRNRAELPGLSDQLGHGFSGNGDLLTFAVRAKRAAADGSQRPWVMASGYGPVITSRIRVPDAADGGEGRGFYLEDAGYPEFASWMLEMLEAPGEIARAAPRAWHYVSSLLRGHRDSEAGPLVSALLGDCDLSSGLLPLLGMGRDIPDGRTSLNDGRLEIAWSKDGASKPYFDRVREVSRQVTAELGAEFVDNPIWHEDRVVTVHALGGCRMATTPREGVVDPQGRVFGMPGLHIADGSVMPGPVGANPSLTIAALADRFADAILTEPRGVSVTVGAGAGVSASGGGGSAPPAGGVPVTAEVTGETEVVIARAAPDGAVSLAFTEEMKGFVTLGESDFERGFDAGRDAGTAFMFHLTIVTDDLDRFIADPQHPARAEGWVESDAFGGRMAVSDGLFNLFVDEKVPGTKRMLYRLQFTGGQGQALTMTGFKEVRHGHMLRVWPETSTLYTRVLAGHIADAAADAQAEVLASGIIHILPRDFAHQLTTFRVHPEDRIEALPRFGTLFAGELWTVYGPGGPEAASAAT